MLSSTKIISVGGFREIGKSSMIIEESGEILLIDAGVKFMDISATGIRAAVPQYDYLIERSESISAVLITHGHEDHLGGLPFLLSSLKHTPVIYAPKIAIEHLRLKLREHFPRRVFRIRVIRRNYEYIFKNFRVDFWSLQHSIPDAFGIRIRSKNATILCTGDFRIDYTPIGNFTDFKRLEEFAKEGITVLLSDSTNALRDSHSPSETNIVENIENVLRNAKKRVIITAFASNLTRVKAIMELCQGMNKKIAIFGRSMISWVNIGIKTKHIKISEETLIDPKTINKYQPKDTVIITTGSQGEELAALSKLASDSHPHLKLLNGDTIIFSSSPIPGNRLKIELLINNLVRKGAIIKENFVDGLLHTSGHAYKEELKKILSITKPKYFFPYHGEYQMLRRHAEIAKECGINPKNIFLLDIGRIIQFKNGEAKILNKLPLGVDFIDGNVLHKGSKTIFVERSNMAKSGVVLITLIMSLKQKIIVGIPRFYLYGVVDSTESAFIYSTVKKLIQKNCEIIFKSNEKWTKNDVRLVLEEKIENFLKKILKRAPFLILNIFMTENIKKDMISQFYDSKDSNTTAINI